MNMTTLACEVADLLEMDRGSPRHQKCFVIVKAIVQAMTEALRRGEKIKIVGFGTFEVVERKAHGLATFPTIGVRNTMHYERHVLPAKNYVRFKSSRGLRKLDDN